MVVGVAVWELHLADCRSLKDKRRVVKSLKDRLRSRFNVSVAETGHQELWQRAELACGVVATDRRHAEQQLAQAERLVADEPLARIIDSSITFR